MNSNRDSEAKTHFRGRGRRWKFPVIVLAVILIKTTVFFFIWNHLIPDLFHGPVLSYGQALGLLVLAKLLFGHGPHKFGGGHPFGRSPWKSLSPEDKERLIQKLQKKNDCEYYSKD